jgi:hypothetical protein
MIKEKILSRAWVAEACNLATWEAKIGGQGLCKVLLNKDHVTCGKGRFIRNPDCRVVTLGFRVKQLG